jgi:RNA polymerase sigma-70 factor (ECF subfamily)
MIVEIIQSIENDYEREAIEKIFTLYYKRMYKRAYDILNNSHDAEDAVQETFYRISCNVKDFLDPELPDTIGLISIYTRNVALNMYNRKKKQHVLFDQREDISDMSINMEAPGEDVEEILINKETVEMVRNAINQLDDMYRDIVLMKYYYHKRNVEIADIIGIERSQVNGRLFRAKKMLREILGEEAYERITNK